jgi:hypothetical protein
MDWVSKSWVLYVRDQDEALGVLRRQGRVPRSTDVRNGGFRWLTVQYPDQPSFPARIVRARSADDGRSHRAIGAAVVAKGAMPPLVLVSRLRGAHKRMREQGVEFTQ